MQAPHHKLSEKQMATMLALLVSIMPFSIDAYLSAIPAMAASLNADIHRIEQSLSTFMFGVAVGQLVGGSISDMKGRRVVALTGLTIYVASVLGLVFIQTADQLLLLRMVQAFGAGMTVVVVGAIVRDNYEGREAAQMFALIGIILMAAPLAAPMLGALLQMVAGWRTIFVFLAVYALLIWLLLYRFLAKPVRTEPVGRDLVHTVIGRYRSVLRTRPALGFLFFQAFSFSSMFVFLTESSFVYMNLYGVSAHVYAWVFGANILTMASFNRVTAWRLKSGSHPLDILKWGIIIQLLANTVMLTSVLLAGMPPMWFLVMCVMLSVGTQGLVTANTQASFMGYFKAEGGSANAVLGVCQSVIAALIGMLTTWLHDGTPRVMAGMMLASTVCGIVLLTFFSRHTWSSEQRAKME